MIAVNGEDGYGNIQVAVFIVDRGKAEKGVLASRATWLHSELTRKTHS